MITLKIKEGQTESVLILIHAGSAETDTIYTDILDCISSSTQFLIAGEPDNPCFVYFENFEYGVVKNNASRLIEGLLLASSKIDRRAHLPANEKVLRASNGNLVVDSAGKYIRLRS